MGKGILFFFLFLVSEVSSAQVVYPKRNPNRVRLFATHSAHLNYYGGPVISNVNVVSVYWGPNVNSNVRSHVRSFYSALVDNPYLDSSAANSHAYSETNSHAYSETNSHAYSETNSHAYSETNSHAYSETNSGANAHPDSNTRANS